MSPPMNVIRKLPKTNTTHKHRGITSERDIHKVQNKTSTANLDHRHSRSILTVKFHRPFASLALSKKSSSNRKLAARLMVDWAWQQAKRRILWFALVSFGSTVLLEVLLLGMHREVVTICCKSHWFSISTLGHDKHHGLISVLVLISRLEGATRQAGGNSKSAIVALALTVGEPLGEALSTGQTHDGWVAPSPNQQEDHVYLYNLYIICIYIYDYLESYKCVKFWLLDNAGKCIVWLSESWGDSNP